MGKLSSKTLALVISAIKNMRESKGSRSYDILNYISSVYDIPQDVAKRQVVAALKRGIAHGILRRAEGYYSLPTDTENECTEVAAQELGLLDLCCRRKKRERRKRKGCKKGGRSRRGRSRRSRKSRKSKADRCGKRGGRSRKRRARGKSGGCGGKSRRGRAKRGKRSGRSGDRCKSVSKRRPKKEKTCCVRSINLKSDFTKGEGLASTGIEFSKARDLRCRSRSRSFSRNRSAVLIA